MRRNHASALLTLLMLARFTDRGRQPGRDDGHRSRRPYPLRGRARRGTLALLVVAGLLTPALLGAVANGAEIPANFLVVFDQEGANDVNSEQVDLTLMGRDDSDPLFSKYVWNWDSIDSWFGNGQTGDACALYDTDGDGKINFAICVRISNPTATTVQKTEDSPFVFTCTDARTDRCSQPTGPLSYAAGDVVAGSLAGGSNLITDTDPFPAGESSPLDSTIQLTVRNSFLPDGAVLVNVCSYPSAGNGGNNNPFDCITPPASGLLIIRKDAGSDTTTPFPFKVNPVGRGVEDDYIIPGSGETMPISVPIGTTSVTETVPAGWALAGVTCVKEGGGSTGTSTTSGVTGVAIESGMVTTCTFRDVPNDAKLTIDKSSAVTSITSIGPVSYTFRVENTGNVALTGVTVTDPKVTGMSCPSTTLAVGAFMICTGSHAVTQAELDAGGNLVNTATADSTQSPPASDTHTIPITQNPRLSIDKSSTTSSVTTVGSVPYTFRVENTGNVTLTNITVTDPKVTGMSCPSTTLAPGAFMICNGSHAVTQAELDAGGNLVNTATADSEQSPPASDTHTIPFAQNPRLSIDKSSTVTSITGTGSVPYTFRVENTGNVTLTNITVVDPKVTSMNCPSTTLAPGAFMTCTGSHTVTLAEYNGGGNLVNTATADSEQSPPASDTHTIPIAPNPRLSIDKSSTVTTVTGIGPVSYTFRVENTGNVPLTGVSVTDPKVTSMSCPSTTLAVGAFMICTGSHTVTQAEIDAGGNLVNLATADSDQSPPATDTHTIPITSTRNLTIHKAAPSTPVVAGDQITYTLTYGNTGNATATNTLIKETIPTGTQYASCSDQCTVSGSSVTWNVGSVGPNTSGLTVTLTVTVRSDVNACSICNVATIESPSQSGGAMSSNLVCVPASPGSDPSTAKANGEAVGLKAYVPLLGIPLVNVDLSRAASSRTGLGQSADDEELLNLDIAGVVGLASVAKASVLRSTSSSQVTTATGARQTSTSTVLGLNVLSGVVTADVVRSVASTTASGTASSYSAAGTTATNLKVLGQSVANATPGTVIKLDGTSVNRLLYGRGSYVAVNEQTGSTSGPASGQNSGGTYKADLRVTMVRVYITGGTIGTLLTLGGNPVEITIAKSTAHSEHKQTPLCDTTAPTQAVSGHAFLASTQVDPLLPPVVVGDVEIPASGGSAHKGVTAVVLPSTGSVVRTTDAAADTTGTNGPTSSTASSYAQVAGACVLQLVTSPCLISATLIRAQANSSATSSSRSSNATGTQFVNLVVAGIPIAGTPAPNTTITLPLGLGFVVLNEQVPDGPETGHTGLTTRGLRVVVTTPFLGALLPGAEVIVTEAHSDATFR